MLRNRLRREVPGLNTSATADISFMLLIFFLVTTSMDVEKAMRRQMPPANPDQELEQRNVNSRIVMTMLMNADGSLMVDEKPMDVAKLNKPLKEFIVRVGAQHIIQLETNSACSYEHYFALQNELLRAYKEVRDAAAKQKYGHSMKYCTEEQRDDINRLYPQRIQEVVPLVP